MWPYVLAAVLGALAAIAALAVVYLPRIHQLMRDERHWRMYAAELDRIDVRDVRLTPGGDL